jgi:hypothetical protein
MANIRVTELDFDTIKENFKDFLRDQDVFTDYDFDASNLSVLMDLLAYNTHYNAVLANMVSNEMFIDTALKRSSVVSLAKQLSYTPRSVRSSEALVNIVLQNVPNTPPFLNLERYKLFNTIVDGTTLSFYNVDAYVATPVNGGYTFENVRLFQGRQLEYYYTVGAGGTTPANKFIVPSQNVDTRTIQVAVQYSGTSSFSQTFTPIDNIVNITPTTNAYFLEENTEGFYQVYFGDNVVGRSLSAGDIVRLSYIVSDGSAGNVAGNLNLNWTTTTIGGESSGDRSITTISKPVGGGDRETIEEIRFNALANYAAQNRAVTEQDYANLILRQLPAARSVNVWGGERNDPPEYGIVYISIAPKTGYVLTTDEKNRIIRDILRPNSLVTMRHAFIDPTYTYLNFNVNARYSTIATNRSGQQISSLINNKITSFIETNLRQFNKVFYESQLHEQLMDVDDSLLSINIVKRIQKRITANINNEVFTGSLYYPVKVVPGTLRSTRFVTTKEGVIYTVELRDLPTTMPPSYSGTGRLELINMNDGNVVYDNIGSINYATGELTINSMQILGYIGSVNDVRISIEQQEEDDDVRPIYNEILLLDDSTTDSVAALSNGITINTIGINT